MVTHVQPCCPPLNSDLNFLILEMRSLWIPIMDRKVDFPWYLVRSLCVDDEKNIFEGQRQYYHHDGIVSLVKIKLYMMI